MKVNIKNSEKNKIINDADIFCIMAQVLKRDNKIDRGKGHFWTVGLTIENILLFVELISIGSNEATIVSPFEVFNFALHKGAASIIFVHNHPSGNLTPTVQDKALTDRLIVTGIIVNCEVLDHLIITEKDYISFKKEGIMTELKKKSNIMPAFLEKIETAKKMKAEGLSLELISRVTGLSLSEIRVLTRKKKDETP
jgi:DNA repair protein RadC